MTIGQRITKLVDGTDMKMQEAATEIGISQGTLSRIMNDKQEPGASVIIKICNYFKVSADWLLFGKEQYATVAESPEMYKANYDRILDAVKRFQKDINRIK